MTKSRPHSLRGGFTLVELLVAMAVLAIILVIAAIMLANAASLFTVNNKHMDANDEARAVFDRMADDFDRIVRRKDVDYIFWKATGNDAMYFYTEGDSYFDNSTTFSKVTATGVPAGEPEVEKNEPSLVGYRVNNNGGTYPTTAAADPDYYQLERLGKPLAVDSAAYNSSEPQPNNSLQPNVMVFLNYPPAGYDIASGTYKDTVITGSGITAYSNAYFCSTLAGAYSNNSSGGNPGSLPSAVGSYPGSGVASVFNDSTDTAYRSVGSQVFRFEYSFQLKDGTLSDKPVMVYSAGSGNGVPSSNTVGGQNGPTSGQRPLPADDSANNNGDGSTNTSPGPSTYSVGSRWWDPTNQIGYICLDATPKNAIWHEIGIQDIAAVIVTIAVIDKQGLSFAQQNSTASNNILANAAAQLPDYVPGTDPANMLNPSSTYSASSWTYALLPKSAGGTMATKTGMPQTMVSQIRIFQRYFYLNSF